jgi:hypothetical protein
LNNQNIQDSVFFILSYLLSLATNTLIREEKENPRGSKKFSGRTSLPITEMN